MDDSRTIKREAVCNKQARKRKGRTQQKKKGRKI